MKLFINIIIGIILIVLGTALWLNKAYLFSLNQDATELTTETKVDIHHEDKAAPKTESVEEKSSNEPEVAKKKIRMQRPMDFPVIMPTCMVRWMEKVQKFEIILFTYPILKVI